jgi:uncharacterized protein with ParB-like and HNH nuclease domain
MVKIGLTSYVEVEDQIKDLEKEYDYTLRETEISDLLNKFVKNETYLDNSQSTAKIYIPDFQRNYVWDSQRKCNYIESLFLGIPIPPLFLVLKDEFANMELIDGVQRLSTINEFVNGDLQLDKLELLDTLNGYTFKELHPSRQRKFNAIGIKYYVINESADEGVFAEIFKRINTGSKVLTESEIRKGTFAKNKFYQFILQRCVTLPEFEQLFVATKDNDKLRGEKEELITRFFAYSDNYLDYKGSPKHFMNNYISQMGKMDFDENKKISELKNTLNFIQQYIPNGFRKTTNAHSIPRVRFEALAIGANLALRINPNLQPNNINWLNSKEFKNHTTSDAANHRNKVLGRVEFVRDCLLSNIDINNLNYAN